MTAPLVHGPLEPGAVIGILGGGQLGRMLAIAAAQLGFRTHVFAPDESCPAADVAARRFRADYDDVAALTEFARSVAVATYEFENVPVAAVEAIRDAGTDVAPNARALGVAQDRLVEKQFVRSIGAGTAPFAPVDDLQSLRAALDSVGHPAILKTRRLGYDGKGQTWLRTPAADLPTEWDAANRLAWEEVGARPSILEGVVEFEAEISVIGARGRDGAMALYDCPRNEHRGGILRRSTVPAGVDPRAEAAARTIACNLLAALDYVGVIGVEFFALRDGSVLVNEFAPRVHNSGHWTLDACGASQFEQHIRAVAGWPLASTARHSDAVMENLIGDEIDDWPRRAADAGTRLHLYGKGEPRPGRKMGHLCMPSQVRP